MERLLNQHRTTIRTVRNPLVSFSLVTFSAVQAWCQAPDVERLRALVEAGAAPRQALVKVQSEVEDAEDDAVLRRTLYGAARIEETTEEQAAAMVAAAQRRVERKKARIAEVRPLVDAGYLPRNTMAPLFEDLEERQRTLELALSRETFLREMASMAWAEQVWDRIESASESRPVQERFDGTGVFSTTDWKRVVLAFESSFGKSIPVSANGDTAVHRALGFDHRGRVDVAVNPDAPEGVWLREYLTKQGIPFYAFRAAIAGKATAPHIHIGPPSLRYKIAD